MMLRRCPPLRLLLAGDQPSGNVLSVVSSPSVPRIIRHHYSARSSKKYAVLLRRHLLRKTWHLRYLDEQPIASIDASTLAPAATAVTSTGAPASHVCSYNWTTTPRDHPPTIHVPGAPPKWTVPAPGLPVTVPPDRGTYFVDQNGAKLPRGPFIPFFAALRASNPAFSFAGVDVLANRNSLRKLLRFAYRGNGANATLRIDVALVGQTLVLYRHDHYRTETRSGAHDAYGHGFEKAFTALPERLADSAGHYRSVEYDLGGLRCVVQCEVDAWYDGDADAAAAVEEAEGEEQEEEDDDDGVVPDGVEGEEGGEEEGEPAQDDVVATPAQPVVRLTGRRKFRRISITVLNGHDDAYYQPSAQQLAELKISRKKTPRSSMAMAQMWFGRTPFFVGGAHIQGQFREVKVVNVAARFAEWERREHNQEALKKVVAIIARLKEILVAQRREMDGTSGVGKTSWAVVCDPKKKPGTLLVYRWKEESKAPFIPWEYLQQFWPEHGTRRGGVRDD